MSRIESGYLLIADITGYTAFLNASELDHARDILNELLGLLVEYTRRPLLISRLEGDAVFSYALDEDGFPGSTLVDLIENTYLAFRKARELMVVNTTCDCRACTNIPGLDLKFFVHHGQYAFQDVGRYKELVGTDVNLIHRLTKNSIGQRTGIVAYAAYTEAAVTALGIDEVAASFTRHVESYDHIGEVHILVQDLELVWRREEDSLRIEVVAEETVFQREAQFPLPPAALWPYVTDPQYRAVIHGSLSQKLIELPGGRLGRGAVYECAHGSYTSRNTIVDWHPFESYTTHETTPIPRTHVFATYRLEPAGEGTRLTYFCSRTHGPFLIRQLGDVIVRRVLPGRTRDSFAAFQALIEEETRNRE